MEASALRYLDSKAPAEDLELLLWPAGGELIAQTRQNHDVLSKAHSVLIQRIPLPELRRAQRQVIGHDNSAMLIGTGHQTELYHPGVWVKDVLIDVLAGKLGGQAVHIAVDTDGPKHLLLRFPGEAEPITDDPRVNEVPWSGLVLAPTPRHIEHLRRVFLQASVGWNFTSQVPEFLGSMQRQVLRQPTLACALTSSMGELDRSLGLRCRCLLASGLFCSEPYLVFVHHLLGRAEEFLRDYNAALHEFRISQGIKSVGQPMPDLEFSTELCEVPFWLDNLESGTRTRAKLRRANSVWALECEGRDGFVFNPGVEGWAAAQGLKRWLTEHRLRLSPRALTLTMFLRLVLCDQFVHGIGGGRYDQVTDVLVARHFRMEAPRFSITTATLHFPGAAGRRRASVTEVIHQGHHLRHGLLGEEKTEFLRQIQSLPRRSSRRRAVFLDMHERLRAAPGDHPALRAWEEQLRQTMEQAREDRLFFDRELFCAIQPRNRLEAMIDRYQAALR